ncbi:uncharacterized protein DUF2631 [Jatrophihabitans sp. GAS493]|uniref:DUF2631 domain-containing protein n=1 Tax=Jatrophihabitans sp. GAS493 TaxID=1907575 RepID=UPI000BB702A7|nr:DUF2631 domain-containing protein [Jatrophihabitans sp. GAS493]SOD74178.1 uncharacterized protein DUF2631 [Jatrophihabitans sp. GAS493]
MPLKPGSEPANVGSPEDYSADHPAEHPSDWGWHGEWGVWRQIGGWISALILVLMTTATHYNAAGEIALLSTAALLVVGLIWDIQRQRTAWRR